VNWAHLHLILNHVPVVGVAIALGLLAAAAFRRGGELEQAALWVLVAIALVSLPAYLTGEPAEDVVSGRPGVSGETIEEHEEAASPAFATSLAMGVIASAALWVRRKKGTIPAWLFGALLIWTLAVALLMARAANLGGQIRHDEIRDGAAPAPAVAGDDD